MEKNSFNQKKFFLIGICIFIILMGIFTFTDLKIAMWIYNPNSIFGRVFEIIGTLPLPSVGVFAFFSHIFSSECKFCLKTIISWIFGVILLGYNLLVGTICIVYQVKESLIPMVLFMLIWLIVSILLCLRIVRNGKREELNRAAIVGVVGCAVAVFGVSYIKSFVSRERFYRLADPLKDFTYWFEIQSVKIQDASFPSGHSAQAAVSFFLMFVPTFAKKFDTLIYKRIAIVFASVFTLCVMISRMVLGMHFATDVLFGATMTIITYFVMWHITGWYHKKI